MPTDHQRDPDRVVGARFALENGAGASADLAVAEYGEGDGRVGRRERGAEDAGGSPGETEQPVRRHCHQPGGRERAHEAERDDLERRGAEAAPPDVQAAVEQDHDQRNDADPFNLTDRDVCGERREQI
jgi:hypothetical protein